MGFLDDCADMLNSSWGFLFSEGRGHQSTSYDTSNDDLFITFYHNHKDNSRTLMGSDKDLYVFCKNLFLTQQRKELGRARSYSA